MEDPRLSVIGDLYEANFSNELRTNLLTRVRDLLGGCHAGILVMDTDRDWVTYDSIDVPQPTTTAYCDDVVEDPWIVAGNQQVHQAGVYIGSDLVRQKNYRRSRHWQQFNKPLRLEHMITTAMPPASDWSCYLTVHRAPDQADFSEAERKLLLPLLPHHVRATRLRLERQSSHPIDFTNKGAALQFDGTTITHMSGDMKALLDASQVCRYRNPFIEFHNPTLQRAFALSVKNYFNGGLVGHLGFGDPIRTPGMDQTAIYLLPVRTFTADGEVRKELIVTVRTEHSFHDFLAQAYGLTQAETELAFALVNGVTIKKFAFTTKRSIHTCRTMSKRLLSKSNAHSQADFVRRALLRIPKTNQ